MVHRAHQQGPRRRRLARVVHGDASMHQFLALAVALCLCSAGTFDVGARPAMPPLKEGDACPDVDGFFVPPGEIAIETCKQELFDARLTVGIR